MNFTVLDIIHFWTDSRGKIVQKIFPTNGKICVYSTNDISSEATKVCNFLELIVKQQWTFQMNRENENYVFTFFPETVSLENLFQVETRHETSLQKPNPKTGVTKNPRVKRETAGDDSNQLNLKCNL